MNTREFNQQKNIDIQAFNNKIIAEFRANNGVVGDIFKRTPLLLLTTTGRKTGLERVNPLAYIRDSERYIIVASFAGAPVNPPWFFNLLSNPEVGVEVGSEHFTARATVLDEPERTELFNKVADVMPQFSEYQSKTTRVIPVIALTRVS